MSLARLGRVRSPNLLRSSSLLPIYNLLPLSNGITNVVAKTPLSSSQHEKSLRLRGKNHFRSTSKLMGKTAFLRVSRNKPPAEERHGNAQCMLTLSDWTLSISAVKVQIMWLSRTSSLSAGPSSVATPWFSWIQVGHRIPVESLIFLDLSP